MKSNNEIINEIRKLLAQRKADQKLSPKSKAKTCFDWAQDLKSETLELLQALEKGKIADVQDELGDVMGCFAALILYAQRNGLDLEHVVELQLRKFERRKRWIIANGPAVPETIEEEDQRFNENKKSETKREF